MNRIAATALSVFCLLLFNSGSAGAAGACDCCTTPVEHSCRIVRELCVVLKYQPGCISLAHRCLSPMDSCSCPAELPCFCHKPLDPLIPCPTETCPERVCHKPLVTAWPVEPCDCETSCSCER